MDRACPILWTGSEVSTVGFYEHRAPNGAQSFPMVVNSYAVRLAGLFDPRATLFKAIASLPAASRI